MTSPTWRILEGDVRERLVEIEDESVQTVVTSPPYWGLRDYGVAGQLGLEDDPASYVDALVGVFEGLRRVLRPDGTAWLNLGDSYASADDRWKGDGGRNGKQSSHPGSFHTVRGSGVPVGLKPKDLVGIPWRVALALQAAGWWLRADVVWAKPNPMPESVNDRPTKSHEYVFLLTRSPRYYYDADAVREPHVEPERDRDDSGGWSFRHAGKRRPAQADRGYHPAGRNLRTVWTIPTEPYPDAHFATFPRRLVVPCVKAGSRPGDLVLDPFAGSGTTGVVALRLERSFVGIELSPSYARLARERIRNDAPLFNVASEVRR